MYCPMIFFSHFFRSFRKLNFVQIWLYNLSFWLCLFVRHLIHVDFFRPFQMRDFFFIFYDLFITFRRNCRFGLLYVFFPLDFLPIFFSFSWNSVLFVSLLSSFIISTCLYYWMVLHVLFESVQKSVLYYYLKLCIFKNTTGNFHSKTIIKFCRAK